MAGSEADGGRPAGRMCGFPHLSPDGRRPHPPEENELKQRGSHAHGKPRTISTERGVAHIGCG